MFRLRFTFVRHPFDRLVSAYVDKFELDFKNNQVYKSKYFLIFFSNIFPPKNCIFSANVPKMYEVLNLPYDEATSPRPTFSQFVDYLLYGPLPKKKYNMHWVPQWLACDLCKIDYDVIGKGNMIVNIF